MAATLVQSPNLVLLHNISWRTYRSLISDFESSPAIQLTYDRGTLEIRTPLAPHEASKKLLGRLIEAATEELDLEVRSLGSLTCDREDLERGLEPDQCYYIQNEGLVREIAQINLSKLPPPDLSIEIDITSSSLNRFSIYADLGVPEIWRFDGKKLTFYQLQNGIYETILHSVALPILTSADLQQFVNLQLTLGENKLIKQFRQWLRSQL